jgi:chromosome segregation ATPase
MTLEANIVYLEEELKNNRERLELMGKYLKENPSVSVYKRSVREKVYYYKKFWKEGKSVSEFLCKDETTYRKHQEEIDSVNAKREKIKHQMKRLKQVIVALEKQLKIARKTYEFI